jgi:hypothetical protein
MTNKDETANRVAQLEQQLRDQGKELAELKSKVDPPKSTFVPMSDAEWIDRMHQMREGRMALATPPEVVRDFAVLDDRLVKEITLRDARAPNTPGMIPASQSAGGSPRSAGDGTGWVPEVPIDVPGGARTQELIERQVNAALPHGREWGKEKK